MRYHAPTPDALDAARLGRGLATLARYVGWVDVVWQRRAGLLMLTLESAATAEALLPPLIAQLLPEVTLEPTPPPERIGAGVTGRWPLPARAGSAIPLFDAPHRLLEEILFVGDLEVRLHLHAREKKWDACVDVACAIIDADPTRPDGWIHRSFALHELKQTQHALDRLLPVADKFPTVWTIPYNLACYACQLSRLDEARTWLQRALKLGGKDTIKRMALNDPDLEPLWEEIRNF